MWWDSILEVARRCPSPHNTQPWKVRAIDDRTLALFVQESRTLPDEDVTGSFIRLAMGMFVESVRIVAANAGARVEFEECAARAGVASEGGCSLFGVLHRVGEASPDVVSNELFLRRRTGRLHPDARPVAVGDLEALEGIAGRLGQKFGWTKDTARVRELLDLNTRAVAEDLNSRRYHDEIVRWFRFGDGHAGRTRDGLSSRCLNMGALELRAAAAFPVAFVAPVIGGVLRWWYRRRVGAAETIGYLSGAFWEPEHSVETGRALLRVWLEMERRGLRIHPFGNLVTNRGIHSRVSEILGDGRAWLVFRVAHSACPPQSERLLREEVTLGTIPG